MSIEKFEKFCEKLDALKNVAQKIPEGFHLIDASVYLNTPKIYLAGGESEKERFERFTEFADNCNQPVLKNRLDGINMVELKFCVDGVWVVCWVGERYAE